MALKLNLALPHPAEADVDTLVLGVFEDAGLSAPAKAVDERCEGQLSAWLTAGDVSGKLGRTALLRGLNGARLSLQCPKRQLPNQARGAQKQGEPSEGAPEQRELEDLARHPAGVSSP
jgi:hypothetical protein